MNPQFIAVRETHRPGLVWLWPLMVALGLALAGCGAGRTPAAPEPTTEPAPVGAAPTAVEPTPTSVPPTAAPTETPTSTPAPAPSPTEEEAPAPAGSAFSFAEDVQPIFTARCIKCHSGDSPPRGLRLDSYEHVLAGGSRRPVIIPGNPAESELVKRIEGAATPRMPFDGPPFLSDEEIAIIRAWIAAGAPNN